MATGCYGNWAGPTGRTANVKTGWMPCWACRRRRRFPTRCSLPCMSAPVGWKKPARSWTSSWQGGRAIPSRMKSGSIHRTGNRKERSNDGFPPCGGRECRKSPVTGRIINSSLEIILDSAWAHRHSFGNRMPFALRRRWCWEAFFGTARPVLREPCVAVGSPEGCSREETTDVAAGRRPLCIHALSPLRPVRPQATGDFARAVAQFRGRHAARGQAGDLPQGLRSRHHPFRSRQQLRPAAGCGGGGLRRDPAHRLPRLPRRADRLVQGRIRHVAGAIRRVGQPQIPDRQLRPEPEAPRPRLCRHLLFPSLRPRYAAGGDDVGARPDRPLRQGALCRHLLLQFAAHARSRRHSRRTRHAVPHPPAELFDDQPLGRGGQASRYAGGPGNRFHRVLAARPGHAHRQVSRRRSRRQPGKPGHVAENGFPERKKHRKHPRPQSHRRTARPDARPDGARLGAAGRPGHLGPDRRQPAGTGRGLRRRRRESGFPTGELAEIETHAREADINLWAASAERKGPKR